MKNIALAFVAGLTMAQLTAFAAPSWTTDLPAAQTQAKKEKKVVLVNFTGSDWCGWCQKLKKEVFDTKEFSDYAKTNLLLVEIDFPNRKTQTAELKKANSALQTKYRAEGFPTILAFNANGDEVWRQVGYMPGGPKAWIAKLDSVAKK
jgi:thioredoxin-related protein